MKRIRLFFFFLFVFAEVLTAQVISAEKLAMIGGGSYTGTAMCKVYENTSFHAVYTIRASNLDRIRFISVTFRFLAENDDILYIIKSKTVNPETEANQEKQTDVQIPMDVILRTKSIDISFTEEREFSNLSMRWGEDIEQQIHRYPQIPRH